MNRISKAICALIVTSTGPAFAEEDPRIARLCGEGHVNEAASPADIRANPDGYYVASLREQISHGDPRIVRDTVGGFHLCTVPAATPEMDANKALLLMGERQVKYLFVPKACPRARDMS